MPPSLGHRSRWLYGNTTGSAFDREPLHFVVAGEGNAAPQMLRRCGWLSMTFS